MDVRSLWILRQWACITIAVHVYLSFSKAPLGVIQGHLAHDYFQRQPSHVWGYCIVYRSEAL